VVSRVSRHAHARFLATHHFASLDGLRCLSILPVIWHHATPRPLPGIWGKGPAGVDLFFCISGFLITTLLLREKERAGRIWIGNFYARRALRIWPLYYLVLLSYLAYALALPELSAQRAHFLRTFPLYATFTANWFADFGVAHPILFSFAWSLCVEEQFYAFWPWLLHWFSRRGTLAALALLLALDWLAERGTFSLVLSPAGQTLRIVTSFSAPIALGSLLALVLHGRRGFTLLARLLGNAWSAPLALGSVFAFLTWPSAPLLAFQTSLAALVAACVVRERHGLSGLLELTAVRYVGSLSYGLYLLNSSALGLTRRLFPGHAHSAAWQFWLSLPLALAFAALSRHTLEARILRLRKHFPSAAEAPRLTASGAHSDSLQAP
jgi:peptidoglycan/LPS O-acetylase OafA/YrhL